MEEREHVHIKVWSEHGFPIARQHEGDAGFDIHAAEDKLINPGGVALISTGIYMEIPEGWECQVRSRSGLAAKHGVFVINSPGTIDSSYRGECKVILANLSSWPYTVKKGDRIAQLVFSRVPHVTIEEVPSREELSTTTRGENGFGSTGASARITPDSATIQITR